MCVTMTSLKTWCLLSLSVLLLLFIAPTETEVVHLMSDCEGFLLQETPPQVPEILVDGNILDQNRYKAICQTYENETRFVTLFDIENRIPVFSAAKYRGDNGDPRKKRSNVWMIEPQLEDLTNDKNMQDCYIRVKYNNQASDKDYKDDLNYVRGHLFPHSFGFTENDKIATCTLTNTVPQVKSFNGGSWQNMETCVKCILDKYCKNNSVIEGYVVTGAHPSPDTKFNNRVNVPSMLWSAFCCYSEVENKWLASAFWGNNTAENSTDEYLETKTLEELQREPALNIEVFPNAPQCPLSETVAKFYPNLPETCLCQPKVKHILPVATES